VVEWKTLISIFGPGDISSLGCWPHRVHHND